MSDETRGVIDERFAHCEGLSVPAREFPSHSQLVGPPAGSSRGAAGPHPTCWIALGLNAFTATVLSPLSFVRKIQTLASGRC